MKLRLLLLVFALVWPLGGRADTLSLSDANQQVLLHISIPGPLVVTDSTDGYYFDVLGIDDVYGATDVGFGSSDYFAQLFVAGAFGFDYFNTNDIAQLYSGDEAAPMLLVGTYSLTSAEGLSYSLTIANDPLATPEPSCVLLCGTGCMLLCCAGLWRKLQGSSEAYTAFSPVHNGTTTYDHDQITSS